MLRLRRNLLDNHYTRLGGELVSRGDYPNTFAIRKTWLAIFVVVITGMAFMGGRVSQNMSLNKNIIKTSTHKTPAPKVGDEDILVCKSRMPQLFLMRT